MSVQPRPTFASYSGPYRLSTDAEHSREFRLCVRPVFVGITHEPHIADGQLDHVLPFSPRGGSMVDHVGAVIFCVSPVHVRRATASQVAFATSVESKRLSLGRFSYGHLKNGPIYNSGLGAFVDYSVPPRGFPERPNDAFFLVGSGKDDLLNKFHRRAWRGSFSKNVSVAKLARVVFFAQAKRSNRPAAPLDRASLSFWIDKLSSIVTKPAKSLAIKRPVAAISAAFGAIMAVVAPLIIMLPAQTSRDEHLITPFNRAAFFGRNRISHRDASSSFGGQKAVWRSRASGFCRYINNLIPFATNISTPLEGAL